MGKIQQIFKMETRGVEIFFKKERATEKKTLIKTRFHTGVGLCRTFCAEPVSILHDTNLKFYWLIISSLDYWILLIW